MARPQRNSVDYFPFLCEEGEKMYYLEETYGNDGFATFVKLLRELAKVNYHYLNLSKPSSMMFLSAKCKVSKETLEAIISDLVMLEKFDKVLWDENKIVWCQDFIDSIQDAYAKRSNDCIDYNSLLTLLDSLGVRKLAKSKPKQSKLPLEGDVNPQSIVEYTKEDKSKYFDTFWSKYPNKTAKSKAKSIFLKLKDNEIDTILDTIEAFAKYKQFEDYSHPMPTTYLNQRRWEDIVPEQKGGYETSNNPHYYKHLDTMAENIRKQMELNNPKS